MNKISVSDDDMANPAAIDAAALTKQRYERRVDDDLPIFVRIPREWRAGIGSGNTVQFSVAAHGDGADLFRQSKYPLTHQLVKMTICNDPFRGHHGTFHMY